MSSAFKLYPADETATGGEYGTSPYGDELYGGSQAGFKYTLPDNEVQGDETAQRNHRVVAEAQHRRNGKLLSARKIDEWAIWSFRFSLLLQTDLDALVQFFEARRFKFLQDSQNEATFIEAHWVETEFAPQAQRGGYHALAFSIEEI